LDESRDQSPLERFCALLADHGVEFIIGLDDLIQIKRYIGRPKDRESLLQLEAIKRLREREGLR
jgi:hypothetical protein